MQVPPEQPLGPGGYPRPSGYAEPEAFLTDKVMGIVLIVLAAFGSCLMLFAIGAGGLVSAVGAGAHGAEGSAQAVAGGGMIMLFGVIGLVCAVIEIVAAVWMMKSLRKGFLTVFVIGAIGLVINIVAGAMGGHFNFLGLGFGLVFPGYAAVRLFGNVGPKPIC